jgi:chemotaxis methyl-accepting protein methylase/chemotaxis response regulator CheB
MADQTAKRDQPIKLPPPQSGLDDSTPCSTPFPIVGIGASAGGLEAFQELIREVPERSGLAYVLIQHLDPEHTSLLREILQRVSSIPVLEIQNQMQVLVDHIYVIPPNRDMTIQNGILLLSPLEQPRGQRMPIDDFFISLANDQNNRSIGVVLSGTGTDGTLGLQAIHDAGGLSIIQDPKSAKYDGMPNSAITLGLSAQVMPAQEMIHTLMNQGFKENAPTLKTTLANKNAAAGILHILLLLRNATGHDFSQYKKSTIRRRVERCMAMHSMQDTDAYADYLKEHPAEMQTLLNELLINVTSFFRDPEAFEIIASEILPLLFKNKKEGEFFRVWVAGCASGEEAYSIAILLREYMDRTKQEFKVLIYATDLDEDSIAEARAGLYLGSIKENVSQERLTRYFSETEGGFRIKRSIRDMVVFAVQNVIKDPPLIKLDLLCCRNLMIYLESELQNRLIPIFHYALKPGGVLFLSPAESIGNHTERFNVLNRKFKIYQALATNPSIRDVMTTDSAWTATKGLNVTTEKIKKNNPVANRVQSHELDPSHTQENLQVTLNEHQASNEELKSTNEELQSTNEELQSTNEELETSKEELQSVNEELITVNTELQKKIEQLAGMQNDMKNLLDNMNIGTIFLDKDMVIRRFTREATRVYRLIPSDVGRSLEDIRCEFVENIDLVEHAKEVLNNLNPFEVELSVSNSNWYLAHIKPYQTLDNIIAGVVMTFTDITARVNAEEAVNKARTLAEGIVDTVLEPLVVLDASLKVVSASRSFYDYFKEEPENTIGRLIYDIGNQQWNIAALRELLETILPQQQSFEGYVMAHTFPVIGLQKMVLNARRIVDSGGNTQLILFSMRPLNTPHL